MIQDFKYGIRMLRRSPGFSLLAILCLTLGIGATTSVFSWIEGILLRPYPLVRNQDRMVALTGTDRNGRTGLSWPDFLDFQKNCTLFDALITDRIFGTTLAVGDRAERASGSIVSANYFQALGIRPVMGRFFERGDDVGRNSHPAAVISYQAWKDRYHGDPNIVGRTQFLNGVQHTIIGVAPEGFLGTFVGYSFQFWVPASMEEIFEAGGYKLENPWSALDRRVCRPEARRHHRAGPGRNLHHRGAARCPVSGDQPESWRSAVPALANPVQRRGHHALHAESFLLCLLPGTADRVCERGESASGAIRRPAPGDDDSAFNRRRSHAAAQATPH